MDHCHFNTLAFDRRSLIWLQRICFLSNTRQVSQRQLPWHPNTETLDISWHRQLGQEINCRADAGKVSVASHVPFRPRDPWRSAAPGRGDTCLVLDKKQIRWSQIRLRLPNASVLKWHDPWIKNFIEYLRKIWNIFYAINHFLQSLGSKNKFYINIYRQCFGFGHF